FCQSGRWSKSSPNLNGNYAGIGSFSGTYNGYNSQDKMIAMQAIGGGCGNRHNLNAQVSGMTVADSTDNNPEWAKGTSIFFFVPAYTAYQVSSYPYDMGACGFNLIQFSFQ
ncbi:hypothetical protein ACPRNU_25810, partial [Chromobacterium vaccinii]|uniref:hypothetical protein n=1 Tax=Chromobacterium vaccinii TaxID=1108595 RepID=UPI003C711A89